MARYLATLTSSAAIAGGTAFAWLGYSTTVGFKLRRVTLGTIGSTTAPTSQQLQVGVNITNAGVINTPVNVTNVKMNSLAAASSNNLISAWTGAPTLASADAFSMAFNSQSGGDWPFEVPEDFWPQFAPANNVGFAFVNRVNALPAGMSLVITVEWEE